MAKMVDYALQYLKLGFSVVPCIPPTKDEEGKDIKKPRIEWTQFMKRKASESEVIAWFQKWPDSRIGIVTGAMSNLFVVDCDSEEAHEKVETEYLPDGLLTPKVKSPHGYHYYFRNQPELRNSTKIAGMGLDTRGEGGFIMAPPSQGLNGAGYTWMKGLTPWKVSPTEMPSSLLTLIASSLSLSYSISNKINTSTIEGGRDNKLQSVTKRDISFNVGTRDDSFFHLATRLIHGHTPKEEIEQILTLINEKCANPPLPFKQLQEKIASAIKRADTHERNLSQEVFEWVCDISGTFSVTECEQALQIVTKEQKANRRQIFHRLIDKGILVKDSIKANTYRAINTEETEIKWWEATVSEFKMRFFFDLQEWVKLYPKNIIVLAGSPNAGKTALMLNLAMRSLQENYRVTYLSSEMDATELKVRLELIDKPDFEEMKKIRFLMRNRDFPDVIDPDGVNIIDFFEITDRFYLIAEELKRIWNKLKTGVAFIALQKDPKKTEGRGGTFGLEIPRLYLTVDYDSENSHALRVIKAKNWKGENPNGFIQYFKIHQGVNLYPKGVWKPEI